MPRNFVETFSPATFRAALDGGLNVLRPVEDVKALVAHRSGR
jgi:hypothetical protein